MQKRGKPRTPYISRIFKLTKLSIYGIIDVTQQERITMNDTIQTKYDEVVQNLGDKFTYQMTDEGFKFTPSSIQNPTTTVEVKFDENGYKLYAETIQDCLLPDPCILIPHQISEKQLLSHIGYKGYVNYTDGIDIIDIIDNAYEAKGIAYEQFESFAIPEFLDIDISDACEQFYTFVNHNSHLKEYVDTCIDNENGVPTLHGYMYFREHQTNTQEINDQMSM